MKAAVVVEDGRLELQDIAVPQPGPYGCLVKIDACVACTGTDLNIISGQFPWREELPVVLGHESTGVIVEAGEKVRNFKVGQRVTRPAAVPPGQRIDGIGSTWGGFAEYGLVADGVAAQADGAEGGGMGGLSRVPMPDDVDAVSAALSVNQREILSVSAKQGYGPHSRVVVVCSGYNGLLFSFFAKHFGAGRVVMVGNAQREPLAEAAFRADEFVNYRRDDAAAAVERRLDDEPSHVIDAVGSVASVKLAEQMLADDTGFGCYGVHEQVAAKPLVDAIHETHPPLDMSTDEPGATEQWHGMWRAGVFAREGMCGGILPFDEIGLVFNLLRRREAVKIVVSI